MMKRILEEVTLRPDEDMSEEATEVLAKLEDIEHFHFCCSLVESYFIEERCEGISSSTHPAGEISRIHHDLVTPNRSDEVISNRVCPLDESVTSLFTILSSWVLLVVYVVFIAEIIEDVVHQPIEDLHYDSNTLKTTANERP